MVFATVKEMKDFLKDLPDDMKLVCYRSDMERNGYMENVSVMIRKMASVEKHTWDRFDGGDYTYTAYENSSDGVDTVVISQTSGAST